MDKEITIINKEKFCDIYNRINKTVDLDEKYANAAERAPMNQKENLPVYTNCKGEKLVDLVGQNNGESADSGAIAALSMATLVRWIGGGHYNNRALSAANLASAGLIANGVKYIIVYDDAKEPYSLVWCKDGTYKIRYKDKFNYLILEKPETFFFGLPFEDEAEEILQSDEEEFVEEEDETEEQSLTEKAQFIDDTNEHSVVELSGADIEKDTVIDVIAISDLTDRDIDNVNGRFAITNGPDWLDVIFCKGGKKITVLRNLALICLDSNGKFVLDGFIDSPDWALKHIAHMRKNDAAYDDSAWQDLILNHKDELFVGKSVTLTILCDHSFDLDKDFVCALSNANVNTNIIFLGEESENNMPNPGGWNITYCAKDRSSIGDAFNQLIGGNK